MQTEMIFSAFKHLSVGDYKYGHRSVTLRDTLLVPLFSLWPIVWLPSS